MSLKRTTWMHHVVVKATAVIVSFVSNAALGQGVNTVVGWGYNGFGQCSPPANLGPCLQVAGGGNQTVALQSSGAVIAWGLNAQGQCNVPKNLGACLQVAAGTNHTAAISNSGIVVVWGDNSLGQCGTSTERVGGRPGNSNSVNGAFWVKTNSVGPCATIAAGNDNSLALLSNGMVMAWGMNTSGQSNVPSTLGSCVQIAAGDYNSLAIQGTLPASNLVASDGAFGNRVQVQWNATANAQSYFVFRAVGGGAAIHIGTCSVPNYSDTTAVAGTRSKYSVRVSSNASGLSIASNSDFGWKR